MLTRIDHVMICVPSLEQGIDAYTRIGFNIYPGGAHPGKGTHNAIAFHGEDYLELMSVSDRAEYLAARAAADNAGPSLLDFLAAGGGFRYVVVQSDDLAAEVVTMRQRGVDVSDPAPGARRPPGGQDLRWKAAVLGERNPLPVFFIQHLTPLAERRAQVPRAGQHPNGVLRIDRAYIAVPDVTASAEIYARVLGMPVPKIQRGSVIKADMAVFDIGPTGLTVAQPAEAGPAAEALSRRGPGPFQVLYRASSMDAAARWMADHGVPPPVRGVRNTGEQAMLVGPEHACGAYIGFAGPA
ncbi:MAG: VOC family protein [Candidatus Rokubacteria bacterium]|nr:VOC family protein [Candidatus Rokubacteria bacterium]